MCVGADLVVVEGDLDLVGDGLLWGEGDQALAAAQHLYHIAYHYTLVQKIFLSCSKIFYHTKSPGQRWARRRR